MPHFVIDCSENILTLQEPEKLMHNVHRSACNSELFDETDIAIMAAAVADYTPVETAEQKIKKNSDALNIEFKKTKDILKSLGLEPDRNKRRKNCSQTPYLNC